MKKEKDMKRRAEEFERWMLADPIMAKIIREQEELEAFRLKMVEESRADI